MAKGEKQHEGEVDEEKGVRLKTAGFRPQLLTRHKPRCVRRYCNRNIYVKDTKQAYIQALDITLSLHRL